MDQKKHIELGLNGEAPLKVILKGAIIEQSNNKIGVVSIVFASMDKERAKIKINELISSSQNDYYMVYSVPFDMDLTTLEHFPSIAVTREDLL